MQQENNQEPNHDFGPEKFAPSEPEVLETETQIPPPIPASAKPTVFPAKTKPEVKKSVPGAQEKPKKSGGWEPIDLSKGPVKKGIYGNRQTFDWKVTQQLKKGLGSTLSAKQRSEVARMLRAESHGGLSSGKVRKGLGKLVKKGVLDKFEARKSAGELKARKRSSFF